jgi:UDPglucose--hexose-1-phosphate uridylyltransferase
MAKAPEWRHDPLTGRSVLISPERAERPLRPGISCPFCEGHESGTPPELLAYRDAQSAPDGPGWRVRVVPNRYAAVRMDAGTTGEPGALAGEPGALAGEPGALATGANASDSRRQALPPVAYAPGSPADTPGSPGIGVAEVFIECPHHETRLRNLSRDQVADVLRAWRDRVRYWGNHGQLGFAQMFHNEGPAAGASVEHCHSQLIAIPFVPPDVEREIESLAKIIQLTGMCPYCRWMKTGEAKDRHVLDSEGFAIYCPPAPRFPGESWLLPKDHFLAFDTLGDDQLLELAGLMLDLLVRVDRVFANPDFNLIVKLGAFPLGARFHWRIELLPRTITTAGWEWGTGLMINTMFPETAARLLRGAA